MRHLIYYTQQLISYKGRCYFCKTQTNFLPDERPEDWQEVLRENFPLFKFEVIE